MTEIEQLRKEVNELRGRVARLEAAKKLADERGNRNCGMPYQGTHNDWVYSDF